MARKGYSTCKGCGEVVPTTDAIIYCNMKYCKKCAEGRIQEGEDYKELVEKICDYFEIKAPTGLILKQIKEYKEQFKYNYAAMSYTLWYLKEIKDSEFDEKYGIAMVKYSYKEAEEYFINQAKIQESVNNIVKKGEKVREIKVNVKRTDKKPLLINIDALIGKGDN